MAYKFTGGQNQKVFGLRDFLGIDLSTEPSHVSTRRSPDSINMMVSDFGALEKRLGYKMLNDYDFREVDNIYSYTNLAKTYRFDIVISESTYDPSWAAGMKVFVGVNALTSDFLVDEANPLFTDIEGPFIHTVSEGGEIVHFPQSKSSTVEIFYHTGGYFFTATYTLGNWVWTFDTLSSFITANTTYDNTTTLSTGYIKIPTTRIARTMASQGDLFEEVNILTPYRFATFLGNGVDVKMILDDKGTTNSVIEVWLYNDTTKVWDAKTVTTHYTYSSTTHIVTFVTAPPAPETIGVDNVKILYSTNKKVNQACLVSTIVEFFGLNGNKDTLFTAINRKEYWGKFSEEIYFGEYGFIDNSTKVVGYSQFGNNLAIHLDEINGSSTINMRTAGLDSQGELTYANIIGVSGVGVYAPRTFANLRDNPLWLSSAGVMALVSNDVNSFNSSQLRSYYLKGVASKHYSLYYAFVFDDKYFLCDGTDIYVADANSLHGDSNAGVPQYEWFKWSNINIRRAIEVNKKLYFLNNSGGLYQFKTSADTYPYRDKVAYKGEIVYLNCPTTDNLASKVGQVVPVGTILYEYLSPSLYYYWLVHTPFTYVAGGIYGTAFATSCTNITSTVNKVFEYGSIFKIGTTYYRCNVEGSYPQFSGSVYRDANSSVFTDAFVVVGNYAEVAFSCYWKTPLLNLSNITTYKTLTNLWVRIGGYYPNIAKIYYSAQGLVQTYTKVSPATSETIIPTNRTERKFRDIQFTVESSDGNPFRLLEIVFTYFENGQIRG